MTPRDWFGVLVRGSGLYLLIVAIPQCIAAIIDHGVGRSPNLLYGIIYLLLGFLVIRFADAIVRFAFPDEQKRPSTGDDQPNGL